MGKFQCFSIFTKQNLRGTERPGDNVRARREQEEDTNGGGAWGGEGRGEIESQRPVSVSPYSVKQVPRRNRRPGDSVGTRTGGG